MLDPSDGRPTRGAASVTVIHADPALADAAATAIMVAGPQGWASMAEALGVELVLLLEPDGSLHMSQAMAERVRLLETPPATEVRGLAP